MDDLRAYVDAVRGEPQCPAPFTLALGFLLTLERDEVGPDVADVLTPQHRPDNTVRTCVSCVDVPDDRNTICVPATPRCPDES